MATAVVTNGEEPHHDDRLMNAELKQQAAVFPESMKHENRVTIEVHNRNQPSEVITNGDGIRAVDSFDSALPR